MKKLQNNFTTPEQSKRLLELGVPAWTADCYYYEEGGISKDCTPNVVSFGEIWTDASRETIFSSYVDVPCWSVGRLIEIITICCNHYSGNNDIIFNQAAVNHGMIECLIADLAIEKKDGSINFSKLED